MTEPYPYYEAERQGRGFKQEFDRHQQKADLTFKTAQCRKCKMKFDVVDLDADCVCNVCLSAEGKPMLVKEENMNGQLNG